MKFFPVPHLCSNPSLIGLAVLLSAACTGQVGSPVAGSSFNDPGGSGGVTATVQTACQTPQAAPLELRRLTPFEYTNTVQSLLGVAVPLDQLLPDPKERGFEGFPKNQVPSASLAERWDAVAEDVANQATKNVEKLVGCDPAKDSGCWAAFATRFGARVYRRPLTGEEVTKHHAFLQKAHQSEGVAGAARMYLAALLQSPSFLYRPELLSSSEGGPQRLDDWAIASRLSYLLWQSMPDQPLFEAARAKRLRTPTELMSQVNRMLSDPKAAASIRHFSEQWLEVDSLSSLAKDAATYPDFGSKIGPLMREELGRFVEAAMLGTGDGLATLFAAKHSFVNAELARFYGWPAPSSGDAFSSTSIPAGERQGILTLGGVMAVHGRPNQSSPIARGKFVRERILCQLLPSPPNDVDIKSPAVRPGATTRERFSDHKAEPSCAGCHALIDPVGFLFERYDGAGHHRTKDQGLVVDASGELISAEDLDGQYADVLALVPKLAKSDVVASCLSTQWFRFAFGRDPAEQDACTMAQLTSSLKTSQGNIKDMLLSLAVSPSLLTAVAPLGVAP